ncbi:MAG: SGNH/GDSL hydrolase family protein [Pirellulales bacterium]|nr:SGNH/GDSL hydrolase family protein [Pirellulales bacterium]
MSFGVTANASNAIVEVSAAELAADGSVAWYDAKLVELEGKGWRETKSLFSRLPAKAENVVRAAVWNLSQQSAGICARFVTDSTEIHASWTLTLDNPQLPTMAASGVSGLDLYARDNQGPWLWAGCAAPTKFPVNEAVLLKDAPAGKREYLLYLPLYNGVTSLQIGIKSESRLLRPTARGRDNKPIVCYGTSITQGACASRPGLCYPAILGRQFDRPVINLGFSGEGEMEAEMAALLGEIDAAAYLIDCLPNMDRQQIEERVAPFVTRLRRSRPQTPIVLVEDRLFAENSLRTWLKDQNASLNPTLRAAYEKLRSSGIERVYYVRGGTRLMGNDGDATGDGSHPNDIGFMRESKVFEEILRPLLK